MKITIKGVNIAKLHDDALVGVTIVGDGSVRQQKESSAWSAMILDAEGSGTIIYGLCNIPEDIHAGELLPYCMAMRSLRNQMPEKPRFRERVYLLSDNRNIVAQHTKGITNHFTSGMWQEIENYKKTHFDIYFAHHSRESSEAIKLMDRICRVVQGKQAGINDAVRHVVDEALPRLQQ